MPPVSGGVGRGRQREDHERNGEQRSGDDPATTHASASLDDGLVSVGRQGPGWGEGVGGDVTRDGFTSVRRCGRRPPRRRPATRRAPADGGSGASAPTASWAQRMASARARSVAGCARSRATASAQHGVVGEVAVEQLEQLGVGSGSGRAARAQQHRQRRDALAQVGARRLAATRRSRGQVDQVVGQLERDADPLAVLDAARRRPRRRQPANIAPNRPEVAISAPVLSASTLQVVLDRVLVRRRGPTVSRIWPVTSRSKVAACTLTASGPSSATIDDARANSRSPVRMATVLPHRALALARRGAARAESMTSSWYSEARWVSSTTTAASTTSGRRRRRAGWPGSSAADGTACRRPRSGAATASSTRRVALADRPRSAPRPASSRGDGRQGGVGQRRPSVRHWGTGDCHGGTDRASREEQRRRAGQVEHRAAE